VAEFGLTRSNFDPKQAEVITAAIQGAAGPRPSRRQRPVAAACRLQQRGAACDADFNCAGKRLRLSGAMPR
jgi:hypothetical protein